MFIEMRSGERFNVLLRDWEGSWVISYDECQQPFFMDRALFQLAKRIPAPEEYTANFLEKRTEAAQRRYELIRPALLDERCITDERHRNALFKKIAEENRTTVNRVRKLYCNYLATGCLTQKRPRGRVVREEYDDAIRKYYFSAKRNSLRTAYELMILERYTNISGKLKEDIPTWDSFRHYYDRYWSKAAQKKIARGGLSNYQRNERMLYGSAMAYRDCVGSYQIDETMGDVFLVSKFDRSKVIGRPYIYLAVDTCTQLITGVYELDFSEYDRVFESNGLLCVRKGKNHGYIEIDGTVVVPLILSTFVNNDLELYKKGYIVTGERKLKGLATVAGEEILPQKYSEISVHDDFIIASERTDTNWCICDTLYDFGGKPILKGAYRHMYYDKNDQTLTVETPYGTELFGLQILE